MDLEKIEQIINSWKPEEATAFRAYLSMGEGRSLKQLSALPDMPALPTLKRYSSKLGWNRLLAGIESDTTAVALSTADIIQNRIDHKKTLYGVAMGLCQTVSENITQLESALSQEMMEDLSAGKTEAIFKKIDRVIGLLLSLEKIGAEPPKETQKTQIDYEALTDDELERIYQKRMEEIR